MSVWVWASTRVRGEGGDAAVPGLFFGDPVGRAGEPFAAPSSLRPHSRGLPGRTPTFPPHPPTPATPHEGASLGGGRACEAPGGLTPRRGGGGGAASVGPVCRCGDAARRCRFSGWKRPCLIGWERGLPAAPGLVGACNEVGGGVCVGGGGKGGGSEGCSCRAGPWLGNGVPVGDLGHPSPLGVCGIGSKRAGRVWALQLSRACSP